MFQENKNNNLYDVKKHYPFVKILNHKMTNKKKAYENFSQNFPFNRFFNEKGFSKYTG